MIGKLIFFQLFVYLPLANVIFPGNAMIIYGELIKVVTFDMIPETWYPKIFDLPRSEPFNDKFGDFGFDGTIYLNNMGFLFAVGLLLLGQYILYILCKPLKNRR